MIARKNLKMFKKRERKPTKQLTDSPTTLEIILGVPGILWKRHGIWDQKDLDFQLQVE